MRSTSLSTKLITVLLLLAVALEHDNKAVEAGHDAPHLKAVDEKDGHAHAFTAGSEKKQVLKIRNFFHGFSILSFSADLSVRFKNRIRHTP